MATLEELLVTLKANTAGFTAQLNQAANSVRSFKDKASGHLASLKNSFGNVINAVFSLKGVLVGLLSGQVIGQLKGFVDDFAEAEGSVHKLGAALESTGRASAGAVESIQAYATELEKVTTFDGDDLVQASANVALFARSLNVQEIAQAQQAVAALAATLGIDLDSAAKLVGKALAGSTGALSRYGIEIDKNATQSERLNQLLEQTAARFEVAKAKTESYKGQQEQLAVAIENLKEEFGRLITEFLGGQDGIAGVTNAVRELTNWISTNKGKTSEWVEAVKRVFSAFGELLKVIRDMIANLPILGNAYKLVENAVVALFSVFKTSNLEWFSGQVEGLTEWLKTMSGWFKTAYDWASKLVNKTRELLGLQKGKGATVQGSASAMSYQTSGATIESIGRIPIKDASQGTTKMGDALAYASDRAETLAGMMRGDLMQAVQGVQIDFRNFGESVKKTLQDIAISWAKTMATFYLKKGLSALFGVLTGGKGNGPVPLPGRASGGPVSAGSPYIVGEKRPELFVPRVSGSILPYVPSGGGGVNVYQTINMSPGLAGQVRAEIEAMRPALRRDAEQGVMAGIQKGGKMAAVVGRKS